MGKNKNRNNNNNANANEENNNVNNNNDVNQQSNNNVKQNDGGGEKKEGGGANTVVLKVNLHCEGCVRSMKKKILGFPGVEEVHGDVETNKLTIKSKVDPWKLHERLQKKTSKKVELVSPLPKKDKDDNNKKPKPDEKKPKEPPVATIVLKVRLQCCGGCNTKLRKVVSKIKGVQTLTLDTEKDLVTVKGAIDPEHLVKYLKYKLNKSVEIVPHKKDGNSNNNNPGGGGNKKGNNEEKISTGGGDGRGGLFAQFDMTKMDYYGNQYGQLYGSTFPYVHAPQIFSDENPNACLIM